MCVLPEDDWECTLGDTNVPQKDEDNTIYDQDIYSNNKMKKQSEKSKVSNDTFDQIEIIDSGTNNINSSEEEDTLESSTESSGDGAEEVELEMREDIDPLSMKISSIPPKASSNIDPNLTAHLQRLSQLIDGLKQTYQQKETPSAELRPDQLNAFLAHHNIKSNFNVIPMSVNKTVPNQTSTIKPNIVSVVLNKTNFVTPLNNTQSSNMNPETKVLMTNYGQTRRHGNNGGYSNSQIVVNRPEGSVVFALPSRGSYEDDYNYQQHKLHKGSIYQHDQQMYNDQNYHSIVNDEPKISEETLKTVLELSKQMLTNQNIRQVYPANNFYPSVLQPIYYPVQSQQHPIPINQETQHGSKPSTIIHNNVIPLHIAGSRKPIQNSYGNQIEHYPPFPSKSQSEKNTPFPTNHDSYGSSEEADEIHYYNNHKNWPRRPPHNRYENNKYVSSDKDEEYYNSGFSTPQPPVIDASHSSFNNYYTPQPHLDEDNISQVFKVNRFV